MIIFLSQIFYSLFLYGLIDWIFESFPIGNGGLMGKSTHTMGGGRSMRTCAYDGGRGSSFCNFGAYVLME